MIKLLTKTFVGMFVLSLMVPIAVKADESAGSSVNTPNSTVNTPAATAASPANTTPAANLAPHKHYRKPKKSTHNTANDGASVPNGMADSLGTNNPGGPNMGSGDHTPGSTGTSGE